MKRFSSLTGLVTAGGRSSRMGSDKGLLQEHGLPWAALAREKLLCYCREVFISISPPQYSTYSTVVDPAHLIMDSPLTGNKSNGAGGPIIAAVSAASKFPGQDLLILASDLTDMAPAVLGSLVSAYLDRPGFSCYAFSSAQEFEPLCAIYRAAALRPLLSLPAQDPLPSLQQLLKRERTYGLVIPSGYRPAFRNRNRPTD